ncbi:MAG: acyltransferase [bacterium]|nr:acyltransferase [bacterium]
MFKKYIQTFIGIFATMMLILNTLFWAIFLIPFSILKAAIRFKFATKIFNFFLMGIGHSWIVFNGITLAVSRKIDWQVTGLEGLTNDKWYLVVSNHQSWTDIVVLQKIFNKKIPFLKFFLKKELVWVPILGLSWWAFDYPFMKRYSPAFLAKNPHLKGKDVEITKKSCAKFKDIPVSVMNFVEGKRFTKEVHDKQESPYRNLLKPKSGGISFVFSTMGEQLSSILNITIAYPGGPYSFWDFLCGKVLDIRVDIEELPVTKDLIGDYVNDPVYRKNFQKWVNKLWEDKDLKIDLMLDKNYYGFDPENVYTIDSLKRDSNKSRRFN